MRYVCCCGLQLVDLKEAEEKSLKESERIEKEIAEVQELKVGAIIPKSHHLFSYDAFCF